MRTIYLKITKEAFWDQYWADIPKDPDKLSSPEDYPLFPICKYIQPGHKIAEIGCGMGRFYKHYFYAGYDIVGIDYVGEAIERLKKENSDFDVRDGSVVALDLPDNTCDVVTAFGTLGNLNTPDEMKKGFGELVRIAKPGGLICASFNPDHLGAALLNFIRRSNHGHKKKEAFLLAYTKEEVFSMAMQFPVLPIDRIPVFSKVNFNQMTLFRWPHEYPELKNLRDGETGYQLNLLGQITFNSLKYLFPECFHHVNVFIFRKHL